MRGTRNTIQKRVEDDMDVTGFPEKRQDCARSYERVERKDEYGGGGVSTVTMCRGRNYGRG